MQRHTANAARYLSAILVLLFLAACGAPGPGGGGGAQSLTVEPLQTATETQTGKFLLQNTAQAPVDYTISTKNNTRDETHIDQWFSIQPDSGTIPGGGSQVIELTTNSVFSANGTYHSVIVVNYPGGQTLYDVMARLPESSAPELSLSETSLTLQRDETSAPVTISVSGFDGTVSFTAFRTDDLPSGQIDITALKPVASPGSTTFQLHPHADAPAGTYEIVIRGESGSQVASDTLDVTVPGAGGTEDAITGRVQTDNARIPLTAPSMASVQSLSAQQNAQRPAYVPGQVLVKFNNSTLRTLSTQSTDQAQLLEQLSGGAQLHLLEAGSAKLPAVVKIASGESVEAVAARMEADPRVAYAEPNYYLYAQSIPNDPEVDQLWNMAASGLPVAWSEKNSASDITVAVIDTGIQVDHPDLVGHIAAGGYDFCASSNCGSTDANPRPDDASVIHGTHDAGILAAVGDNGQGVAGVLYGGARIVPIKAFYQGFTITVDSLSKAIRYASGETIDGQTIPEAANI
ncbi:MAG TPA: S8 family serine peptidase, partial [Trueperaceae bacterium]